MKSGFRLRWLNIWMLGAGSCLMAALGLPSCGGADFTSEAGSASGAGGEAGAGGSVGGGGGGGDTSSGGTAGTAGTSTAGTSGEGGSSSQGVGGENSGGASDGGSAGSSSGSAGAPPGGDGTGGSPTVGVKAFDDFVASAEGWSVTGDDTTKTVKYSSTGGKPNGSISAEEATTGTMFFTAPAKYLGDASAYYGGELRFDLKAGPTEGDFFGYADVELTSNLITLAYDCTPNPTTDWQNYVVPLSETGWKLTTVDGAPVTAAQFKAVLANLTRVRIRAEFSNEYDTGYLDNVYLGAK